MGWIFVMSALCFEWDDPQPFFGVMLPFENQMKTITRETNLEKTLANCLVYNFREVIHGFLTGPWASTEGISALHGQPLVSVLVPCYWKRAGRCLHLGHMSSVSYSLGMGV